MERRTVLVVAAVILGAAFVTFGVLALTGRDAGESPSPSASASAGASSSPSPSLSASASPSDEPSPSPTPSEPSGPLEIAWEPVSEFGSQGNLTVVSFLDGRWFAAGGVYPRAAIWTSDDGRSWSRAEMNGDGGDGEVVYVHGLAERDGRLVAIGSFGALSGDQIAWVTWTSDDGGATWTEDRDGPSPFPLDAITAGGSGFVGAGRDYVTGAEFNSWIALSADGINWERLPVTLEGRAGSLTVIGERIVAVGSQLVDGIGPSAAAWYSDDGGRSWTAADVPDSASPETMIDAIATDDGLLAVGPGDGPHGGAAAWLSADGSEWERFTIDDVAGAVAVASVDGGFVAVGNVREELDVGAEFTWTSVDGRAWEAGLEIEPGAFQVLGVAGNGSTAVAGGRCVGDVCANVLWIGEVTR